MKTSQKINLLNRNLRINKNQFKRRAISSLREEKAARIRQVDQAALIQRTALQKGQNSKLTKAWR